MGNLRLKLRIRRCKGIVAWLCLLLVMLVSNAPVMGALSEPAGGHSTSAEGGSPEASLLAATGSAPLKILADPRSTEPKEAESAAYNGDSFDDSNPSGIEPEGKAEPRFKESVSHSSRRGYVLGPDDELLIIDPSLGTEEVPHATETIVAPDGTVSLYPVGILRAEGLTIQEFTDLINDKERALVRDPQVVVVLRRPRPVNVHVLGEVVNPGLYSDAQTTIPKEPLGVGIGVTLSATETPPIIPNEMTVLTAIQLAGGLRDTADIRKITVTRSGGKLKEKVDLWRVLVEGDSEQDLELRSGDSVFVPRGGAQFDSSVLGWAVRRPRPVRIIGNVNRPGLYYLGPDDDLITLLAKAGGFDRIAKQRYVILSRRNHDGTVTTRAVNFKAAIRNHDKAGRASVMPGDIISVHSSIIRRTAPLVGYVTAALGLFVGIRIINASLPSTFMKNLNRAGGFGGGGGGGVGNFGGFGAGALTGAVAGFGAGRGGGGGGSTQASP